MRSSFYNIDIHERTRGFMITNITLIIFSLFFIFSVQISNATSIGEAAIEYETSGDYVAPANYRIKVGSPIINRLNSKNTSVILSKAEVGASYCYSVACDAGGILITGTGVIKETECKISGIDVSKLPDGNLTYCVVLTDVWGNAGDVVSNTVIKSQSDISNFKKQQSLVGRELASSTDVSHIAEPSQIGYYLTTDAVVSLTLMDILGDVVKVVINEQVTEVGAHAQFLNDLSLVSGVYFYKLNVWSLSSNIVSTLTKKFIVN